ncbi:hypothetical protein IQ235_09135, partial [Oscillatoriales cyanobacterium LEGE 11467]|nr:hypothetical protein [Zarconia navalis LEGE 11467]
MNRNPRTLLNLYENTTMQESSRNTTNSNSVDSKILEIEESGIFEEQEYLELNPDVAAAVSAGVTTATEHFTKYGFREERQFSRLFDAQFYLNAHSDVAAVVSAGATTAAEHFFKFGVKEERSFNALFDRTFYLKSHNDIAAAVSAGATTATQHFFKFGIKEERSFNALFNRQFYLKSHNDIAAAVSAGFTTAEEHFFEFGVKEERSFNALFDRTFYLSAHPDVAAVVSAGFTTAEEHFFEFGVKEERSFNTFFDRAFYLNANLDVAAAVSAGVTTATEHFFEFGIQENRSFSALFNSQFYLNANPDVAAAVSAGVTTAAEHFFEFGIQENRNFTSFISPLLNSQAFSQTYTTDIANFFNVESISQLSSEQVVESIFDNSAPAIDIQYVRTRYAAELESFYGFAVAELSDEQVNAYALEQGRQAGLTLSPLDIDGYRVQFSNRLVAFYQVSSVERLTIEQVRDFMVGEGLSQGIDITGFVDISYYRSTYQASLSSQFGVEFSDRQVVDFVFGDAAPYLDEEYYKSIYGNILTAEGVRVADLTSEQLKVYVFTEGWNSDIELSAVNIEGYRLQYATQLSLFYFGTVRTTPSDGGNTNPPASGGGSGGSGNANSAMSGGGSGGSGNANSAISGGGSGGSGNANSAMSGGGSGGSGNANSAMSGGGGDMDGEDGGTTTQVDISELTDKEIIEFMFGEGLKQGISPLEFVEITEIRQLFAAELTQFYSVTNVAELSDNLVLDFLFGGVAEKIDYEFYRSTYSSELAAQFGVSVELISETQILDHVYQVGFVRGFQLSPIDFDGYIAQYTTQIASHFSISIEEVSKLSIEKIREFIFDVGVEQGLSLTGFVETSYIRSTYAAAIATSFDVTVETVTTSFSDEQIIQWFATEFQSIDLEYVRYEVTQLSVEERTTLFAALGFTVDANTVLSAQQIVEIAYSSEFKAILEVESAKTIAIDIEGYLEKYAEEVDECLGGHSGMTGMTGGSPMTGDSKMTGMTGGSPMTGDSKMTGMTGGSPMTGDSKMTGMTGGS